MKTDRPWHTYDVKTVSDLLGSGDQGLSAAMAAERLGTYGPNELKRKEPRSVLAIFVEQFKNVLIYILLAAMLVSLLIGEAVDAVIIGAIVVVNALLGAYQEYKAEVSIESLQRYMVVETYVIRDGHKLKVQAAELVPGDLVELEAGDYVPADARVVSAVHMKVDESALTGESVPVQKNTAPVEENVSIGDMEGMMFAGTVLTDGRCRAIVVRTGMETEIGRIAGLVESGVKRETPVQISLDRLGKVFGMAAMATCVIIFGIGTIEGKTAFDMFLTAVSLAVAAIPEGLPATVTIIFALGVQRMAGRKAIIRKLSAVETLGSTNVICSDKTGTLTQNVIVVRRIVTPAMEVEVTGGGYYSEGEFLSGGQKVRPGDSYELDQLLKTSVLCNNATYERMGSKLIALGDSTEVALLVAGAKAGLHKHLLEDECPRHLEVPFSSESRFMLTVNACEGGTYACLKGAPEVVLEKCAYISVGGKTEPLTGQWKEHFLKENARLASGGMRVLGFACWAGKDIPVEKLIHVDSGYVFLGIAGMFDPPRPEVKGSIDQCHRSGINVVMITGDHALTARSIAKDLGIMKDGDETVNGAELTAMPDETLDRRVGQIKVYARTSPEQKLRIVRSMQKRDSVVAMTGDGVNDAPALKSADIGVSMGLTGTDVARQASDMVLADDNFATIVNAIEEGRNIYENVRKTVKFLFSCNIGEVLTIFLGIMLNMPLPLLAIQILWVNLITDSLPAMALGMEPPNPDAMKRPPRKRSEGIITRAMAVDMALIGSVIGIGTLGIFYYYLPAGIDFARTMTFSALVVFQLWNVLNCKAGESSVFKKATFDNIYVWMAIVVAFALLLFLVYVPVAQGLFGTVALSIGDWLVVMAGTSSVVLAAELRKAASRMASRAGHADR